MELTPEIIEKLERLEKKYATMGQDMVSYLEGLIHTDYLQYWDYVHLDVLLNLQHPRTHWPDEKIFIIYHQITELYFKMCMNEFDQILTHPALEAGWLLKRVNRLTNYFRCLIDSFSIMVEGMEKDQFLNFRMALLPASGFQSVQYRQIEICATDFIHLVDKDYRNENRQKESIAELYNYIYWKKGATELSTGQKTLTLQQFENKYDASLLALAQARENNNLYRCYLALPESQAKEKLKEALRLFDQQVNINWPLAHYKSAVRYLQRRPEDIAATGGTNWQKYLPPRFQKRIFYPELWSEQEIGEWGKSWVDEQLAQA